MVDVPSKAERSRVRVSPTDMLPQLYYRLWTRTVYEQQSHIHACREKEAKLSMCNVKYSFRCFQFYQERNNGQSHCATHLEMLPLDCGVVILREATSIRFCMQDGTCPLCADPTEGIFRIYRTFGRSSALCKHVLAYTCDLNRNGLPNVRTLCAPITCWT